MEAEYFIGQLIRGLGSRDSEHAWSEFLKAYAPLIFQIVRLFERDHDQASDCFLYVCEQLSQRRFRRLRKFRPSGPARFETWLRAVVRNLCLDWHRKEFGRERVFRSIARLSPLEQEVYRCVYEHGFPADYALSSLTPHFPQLTYVSLQHCIERIEAVLTPRQRWLLSLRRSRRATQERKGLEDGSGVQVAAGDDPESWTSLQERREALLRALGKLSARERLLIRLRFEEDLTLEQVARVFKLADAQSADRRIRELLDCLRNLMK